MRRFLVQVWLQVVFQHGKATISLLVVDLSKSYFKTSRRARSLAIAISLLPSQPEIENNSVNNLHRPQEGPRSFALQSNSCQTNFSTMLTTTLFVVLISFCFSFLFRFCLGIYCSRFGVLCRASNTNLVLSLYWNVFVSREVLVKVVGIHFYRFIDATSIASSKIPRELAG